MTRVETSILIHSPLEEVFTRIAQHDHCSDWLVFVTSATITSEGRVGVGVSAHHLGKVMGRRMEWDGRIIEWVENERIVWQATSGLPERMEMMAINWVRGESDVTRYGLEVEYHAPYSVFGKIMDLMLIKRSIRKSIQTSTQNLKGILEQDGRVVGRRKH